MENTKCLACGRATNIEQSCSACANTNGGAHSAPPPEVADWVIEPVPPEIADHFRQTFDEAEYLAAVRELDRTDGVQIDDLIADLERRINGSD